MQNGLADFQIDLNSIQKKYYLLEINIMTKILLFRMRLIIGRGCLFDGLLCIIFIFIIDT